MKVNRKFSYIALMIFREIRRYNYVPYELRTELPELTATLQNITNDIRLVDAVRIAHNECSIADAVRFIRKVRKAHVKWADFIILNADGGKNRTVIDLEKLFKHYTHLYPLEYAALFDVYDTLPGSNTKKIQ